MHAKATKTLRGGGVRPVLHSFRFFPQGNSTTPMTASNDQLWDPGKFVDNVTQLADGIFRVTFTEPALKVTGLYPITQLSANNVDLYAQAGDISSVAAGSAGAGNLTADIRLKTGATNTVMAANTNNSVFCLLFVEDSSAAGID